MKSERAVRKYQQWRTYHQRDSAVLQWQYDLTSFRRHWRRDVRFYSSSTDPLYATLYPLSVSTNHQPPSGILEGFCCSAALNIGHLASAVPALMNTACGWCISCWTLLPRCSSRSVRRRDAGEAPGPDLTSDRYAREAVGGPVRSAAIFCVVL